MALRESVRPEEEIEEIEGGTTCTLELDDQVHWDEIVQLTVKNSHVSEDVIVIEFFTTDKKLRLHASGECCSTTVFEECQLYDLVSQHIKDFTLTKIACEQNDDGDVVDTHRCNLVTTEHTFHFKLVHTSNGWYNGEVAILFY